MAKKKKDEDDPLDAQAEVPQAVTEPAAGPLPKMKRKAYEREMRVLHGELVAMQEWVKKSGAKICVVFLGAMIPILINTYAGVLNSDGDLIEMARSAGATELQIFRKIMLPGAMPYIIAGMRVGAALALINTVVAELYTAVEGLGGLLSIYGNTFRMAPYFVVVFVLGMIGLMTMQSLKFIERRVIRGRPRE